MSTTNVQVRITRIHCGNTEDVTGGDELYFTSVLTDGSDENTQAEIVGTIPINDDETIRPNALIYGATLPNDRVVRGGIEAFDEDSAKDWAKKPSWVEDMKNRVVELAQNRLTGGAAVLLDAAYEVVEKIVVGDDDDKLGRKTLEIPVSGPEKELISWRFVNKGDFLGYSSWNYTVDIEVLRTPVASSHEGSHTFPPLGLGNHTIQQKSNGRFMDAHTSSEEDFPVVTSSAQNDDTHRWRLTLVGAVYTIQQSENGQFLDAHLSRDNDFSVVTRPAQHDDTQRWVLLSSPAHLSTYTIQQLATARHLDAHEASDRDFGVVTRERQDDDSQRWILTAVGGDVFTLRQAVNGRFLDAHTSSANDFGAVTRTEQKDASQRWSLTPVGGVYTIQQVGNGRFLDAHTSAGADFSVVTRTASPGDGQRWVVRSLGDDLVTIQHLTNGQFLDAHESSQHDYSVVTRPQQGDDTQKWIITPAQTAKPRTGSASRPRLRSARAGTARSGGP